jgi:hypothetical protein
LRLAVRPHGVCHLRCGCEMLEMMELKPAAQLMVDRVVALCARPQHVFVTFAVPYIHQKQV